MQIVDNRALLITSKMADQINNLIPKSKVIARRGNVGKVLVHWGLDECQVLRNLNIKGVPHPILKEYNWPGVYTPFAHQKDTAQFCVSHRRAYVLNEMGTSKTISVAWAADYLMTKGIVKRVLVACPLSIMETAWQSDLFKSIMHRTVGIAHGSREVRKKVINGHYEFVIINHDGIKLMASEIEHAGFDLIIVDELNCFKNSTTDRSKALHSIIKPTTWVWGMTGSPAAQSPVDAYGLAKVVRPDSVPRFFGRFRDSVMIKRTNFKWVPRHNANQIVFNLLQPAIRYTKEECLDLPEQLYTDVYIEMSPQQRKYYEKIRKEMSIATSDTTITAVNAATLMNKLLQISTGSAYATDKSVIDFDIKARFEALKDLIDNTRNKVIVFAPFKHTIEQIMTKLNQAGISAGFISGEVSLGKRTDLFKRFQTEENPKVIVIQPQAAAHGVTLTKADTIVWWGAVSSTETYVQANARAHRQGQKNKVLVVHMYSSKVEKNIFTMLQKNLDVHQSIVDLYKQEVVD